MRKIVAIFIAFAFVASTGIVFTAPAWGWMGPSGPPPDEPVVEELDKEELKVKMKADLKRLKEDMRDMSKEEKKAYKERLKEKSKYYKLLIKELEKK
jgi:hypothetical protein